jgi:hypothetical protein
MALSTNTFTQNSPWSSVLMEKLKVAQPLENFKALYGM